MGSVWYMGTHPELVDKVIYRGITVPSHKVPKLRQHWKNSGGGSLPVEGGDFLSFENPDYESIRNDTLFIRDAPVAVIVRVAWRISFDYEMELRSIPKGKEIWFVSKGGW